MDEWIERVGKVYRPVESPGPGEPAPAGRGFVSAYGGPVTAVMDDARVDPDPAFRRAIMKRLIDAINDEVLAGFHAPLERVFHVDSGRLGQRDLSQRGGIPQDPGTRLAAQAARLRDRYRNVKTCSCGKRDFGSLALKSLSAW